MCGLVCYHGTHLKDLTLNDVNIPMFVISSGLSFISFNDIDCIPLKKLSLRYIRHSDSESWEELARLYIQNSSINLESFTVYNNREELV